MGNFVNKTLLPGEKLKYTAHIHPIIFIWVPAWVILGLLVGNSGVLLRPLRDLLFLIAIIVGLAALLYFIFTEFGVTDRRIVYKAGWIARDVKDMLCSEIEVVQIEQGYLGRLFDYARVNLIGTGGTVITISPVSKPFALRKSIENGRLKNGANT